MDLINEKTKELYGKEESFCKAHNIDYKNFSRTKKKWERWINEINETIKHLGLKIQIAPLAQTGQKENDTDADSSNNEQT